MYKFVNMHIYYNNHVNIHNYCNCLNNFLLSPTHQTSPFLFSPKSLLSPSSSSSLSSSHSLPLSSSKQDKAGPATVQPPHPSQKSHLYQTPKPKSNYTHNSKQQKPNKITKSPNPRENPKLKAFCLWLLIGWTHGVWPWWSRLGGVHV